jgi:hypothetical protein
MCRRYDRPIVYIFELAINRTRRLLAALAAAAAVGGLIGSPVALADDDPPPPPSPAAPPAVVPEIPRELHCIYVDNWLPCDEVPSLPPPDAPRTPDGP